MFSERDSVLVIGAGRSGLAAAEAIRRLNARVAVFDDKPRSELAQQIARLDAIGARLITRDEFASAAASYTAAVLSPGVPAENRSVKTIRENRVPVYSEIELAYRLSAAPIAAVTGSKGKSTTTALISHVLACAGFRVHTGGNIGNPLVREAAAAQPGDWIVAEVSSFQLECIERFAPRISVLLNVGADHLDRYASVKDYASAKLRIFENQKPDDHCVVNADDAVCRAARDDGRLGLARQHWFSAGGDVQAEARFESGALVLHDLATNEPAALARPDELKLRGRHNIANALAASLAARAAGAGVDAIRSGLRSFEPLAHRLTTVAHIDGVEWVDDSKASNPDAVVRALATFDAPVVLIAGGLGKKLDFAAMGKAASRKARAVVLIGRAAHEIGSCIEGVAVRYAASLEEAVDAAGEAAKPGDVVLLSPGCASFDMFESAEQRGELFSALALKRAAKVHAR